MVNKLTIRFTKKKLSDLNCFSTFFYLEGKKSINIELVILLYFHIESSSSKRDRQGQ